jgi:AcrR family transcriptional regulator
MPKKGLTRDLIIDTALTLVDRGGPQACSMRELAEALDVKAASLYNHIAGMDDLMGQVGLRAVELRTAAQLEAIEGKTRLEALLALAETYHAFAIAHPHLDRTIMGLQRYLSPVLPQAGKRTMEPILQVLDSYALSDEQKVHWQRMLRATMHGFCFHEHIGGFSHSDLPASDSYHLAIRCIHQGLTQAERT